MLYNQTFLSVSGYTNETSEHDFRWFTDHPKISIYKQEIAEIYMIWVVRLLLSTDAIGTETS